MYFRAHISIFAVGSVLLLGIDLLSGGGGIWADTAIGAWGMLVVVHGILMIIARLLQELLADDGEQPIRPSSEMHWSAPTTWALPPHVPPGSRQDDPVQAPAPSDRTGQGENPPEPERVSWKAATDAAWLSQRKPTPGTPGQDAQPDDKDDFTPLKLD